jgi:hypothetical protein
VQTLGLAESTPRTENRLKSLFWPSIQTATDVDYLGVQGFWVCFLVASISLVILTINGHPIAGIFVFLFNFLSAIGVRERSRYASAMALAVYVLDAFTTGINVVRIIFTAILISNVRATWIAAHWKPESEEAVLPPRLNETIGDKLSDGLPAWLWPKARVLYYIYSAALFAIMFLGLIIIAVRRAGR